MGQYGALGYALAGQPAAWILDHFYGGSHAATMGNDTMTVRLTRFDGLDTIVVSENNTGTVNGTGAFTGMRARLVGPNSFQMDSGPGCAGPWAPVGAPVTGSVTFATASPTDDHTTMLQACEPGGSVRWYRGQVLAVDGGVGVGARTVSSLPIESYARGVVPRESPSSWGSLGGGAGEQALMAQAVAARSYSASENRYPYAKTCDTTACQVYGGRAVQDGSGYHDLEGTAEYANSDQAVASTAGQIRKMDSDNSVARTEFSSSTGGYTAGGTFTAVTDDGDAVASNPNHNWTASVPVSDVESAYPQVGSLLSVQVTGRNGLGAEGGRVTSMLVHGTAGDVTPTGESFRSQFNLKSNWFSVTNSVAGGVSGYWVVAPDGGVFAFGEAKFYGSTGNIRLNQPVVGMGATTSGGGYWLVARDGGIFSYGDAAFHGSAGAIKLNQPVVGMAATPSGGGYWLVATDGGIFAYGDAQFRGSTGAMRLNKPVVGMTATPSGNGYWLVASDGGIFAYGDAQFWGSTGAMRLNQPIVAMAATPTGGGYWLVGADGGIFAFGDARYFGSLPGSRVTATAGGIKGTATGNGYLIVAQNGKVYSFGDAPNYGDVATAVRGYGGGVRGLDVKRA
jgi:SpoIID/LytB domain protein